MKKSFALSCLAVALVCLVSGVSAKADVIDFETLSGPDLFSLALPQTLTFATSSGTLTITGGTILTAATNTPADTTSVYGTENAFGYSNTITLNFTSPISNFFFDLLNGQTVTDTYTVSDNLGNSQTFTIAPNTQSGLALVSFPTVGNVITITTNDPNWDFLIDNIGFNEPTPGTGVPEPGTLSLLAIGALGLVAVKLSKR